MASVSLNLVFKLNINSYNVPFFLQCEMALPVFHTPLTDAIASWGDGGVRSGPCNLYYEDFKKCISVCPYPKAAFVCDKVRADYAECATRNKQVRLVLIYSISLLYLSHQIL